MEPRAKDQPEKLAQFVDELGLAYEELGFPRAWGRVVGWLLVCKPDFQSADELTAALHASRGAISMTTKALIRAGMIERYPIRGDRRIYYRLHPGAWTSIIEIQIQAATKLRQLAEQGLELLGHEPAEHQGRLEEMHDLFSFYESELPTLLDHWYRKHRQDH
jgi:DNA-binding transcriptional regulator GbsR (MarR family)